MAKSSRGQSKDETAAMLRSLAARIEEGAIGLERWSVSVAPVYFGSDGFRRLEIQLDGWWDLDFIPDESDVWARPLAELPPGTLQVK